MPFYLFGYEITVLHLLYAGMAIPVLYALFLGVLNSIHDDVHGDYRTRQALFMHSRQDKLRCRSADSGATDVAETSKDS